MKVLNWYYLWVVHGVGDSKKFKDTNLLEFKQLDKLNNSLDFIHFVCVDNGYTETRLG